MSDYLMRNDAPLTEGEWNAIDETVVSVARHNLVCRRLMTIYGPLGAGLESVHADRFAPPSLGAISYHGDVDDEPIEPTGRAHTPLLVVNKDFRLSWRALEMTRQLQLPLDTAPAAAAAVFASRAEDSLLLFGHEPAGVKGLLNADGVSSVALTDWSQSGAGFDNLVEAVTTLSGAGYTPPFGAILSPALYASLLRVYKDSDTLEISHAKEALTGGIFESPVLNENQGVVLAVGRQNIDLAIGQDMATAYLESKNLNHYLRVFETVALRIKRPGSICVLGA